MPKLSIIVLLVFLVACKQKEPKIKPVGIKPIAQHKPSILKSKQGGAKSDTVLKIVSAGVDGQRFKVICTSAYLTYVLNAKKDTLYSEPEFANEISFKDFNNDGYEDIMIGYLSNTPGLENLLLYDKTGKTFREVKGFTNFPASEHIKNTGYYYSYERQGCADMNWESSLFYIKDFKAIEIGRIQGYECADNGIKDGIYIYKGAREKRFGEPFTTLPIATIKQYKNYKWGFIKNYWYKNYRRFL